MLFEHGFKLENASNEPCVIYMTLYTESVADQTDHFADVFVRENVAYGYGVMTFESLHPTPICLKSSVRKGYFNNLTAFSVRIWLNLFNYARITITHVFFIAFTLAGSLRRCLSTRPFALVFKQLPRDPANVNA